MFRSTNNMTVKLQDELKRLRAQEQTYLAQRNALQQVTQQLQADLDQARAAKTSDDVQIRQLTARLTQQTNRVLQFESSIEIQIRLPSIQTRISWLEDELARNSSKNIFARFFEAVASGIPSYARIKRDVKQLQQELQFTKAKLERSKHTVALYWLLHTEGSLELSKTESELMQTKIKLENSQRGALELTRDKHEILTDRHVLLQQIERLEATALEQEKFCRVLQNRRHLSAITGQRLLLERIRTLSNRLVALEDDNRRLEIALRKQQVRRYSQATIPDPPRGFGNNWHPDDIRALRQFQTLSLPELVVIFGNQYSTDDIRAMLLKIMSGEV